MAQIGTIISLNLPEVASQILKIGYDFIFIDLEHGNLTSETINSIILSKTQNKKIFVRIKEINEASIKYALDSGADGIIAPRIENVEEIRILIDYSYYPPYGKRSVGFCLANSYGMEFVNYMNTFKPILLPQIESIRGIEIVEDVLSFEEINGVFIGPYDLSLSMGIAGQFESDEYRNVYTSIRDKCKEYKKLFCTFTSSEQKVLEEIEAGTDIITYGVDSNQLIEKYKQSLKKFINE
jgi:4-hydroxy-2-oxoheptanedioate aldolase